MAFKKIEFATGDTIIKQGDAGDLFYILDSGTCDSAWHSRPPASLSSAPLGPAPPALSFPSYPPQTSITRTLRPLP